MSNPEPYPISLKAISDNLKDVRGDIVLKQIIRFAKRAVEFGDDAHFVIRHGPFDTQVVVTNEEGAK